MKEHTQYFVGVLKRYEAEKGETRYYNALMWYPNRKAGARYVTTEEEARKVLEYAYQLWNGTKTYDSNGKRYEHSKVGMIGVSIESTRKSDRDHEIVSHVIQRRTVTEWEEVESV